MSHADSNDPRIPPGQKGQMGQHDEDEGAYEEFAARVGDERVIPDLTHEDYLTLPIDDLIERSGLKPPADDAPETEREWREKAWQSHVQDVKDRDEWGTATQSTAPPKGEEPNL